MAVDQGVSPPASAVADAIAPAANGNPRMPQLDTLRAFAVFLVIVSHWLVHDATVKVLPLGMIGVTVFFVLSGFLITGILLREKAAIAEVGGGLRSLGHFYARRTLRIFPVYYLTLLLLLLSGVADFRGDIGWYVGYAANILFYDAQAWIGPAPHLWTLSVEEQFYLLWPLLILFMPTRYLRLLIVATIALGPLSRGILFHYSNGSPAAADFAHVLMPSCMDCFGLGALLAFRRIEARKISLFGSWPSRVFLLASLAAAWWYKDSYELTSVLIYRLCISVIALSLVAGASRGFSGLAKSLMEIPALMYLGKISYGMYLFHLFIPGIYDWLGLPAFASAPALFAARFCLLVLLAAASWRLFERPINDLKRRYAYTEAAIA